MKDRRKDRHAQTEHRRNYMREYARKWALKKFFGLSWADFQEMLARQDSRCAICLRPFEMETSGRGKDMYPHVDHCHTTGVVRGLLCNSCNVSLGLFGECVETLKRAIGYVERNKQKPPK